MSRPRPCSKLSAPVTVPKGLVWVSDSEPGIRRTKRGGATIYLDAGNKRIRDAATLDRIRRLAVPPAYESVWICADPDGHLQATGRDARGRKQYRYHPLWQQQRGEHKFESLLAFGEALPRIRARVQRDLAPRQSVRPTRTLVLATLVRLLDTTFMRIGNEEYARGNGSYGLTTLRTRHVDVDRTQVRLTFKGKSGVRHEVKLADRRVAAVVRRCKALPGQELFQYVDADGSTHRVTSSDVNDYLAEAAGIHVTAKDFRTWHGSVLALDFTHAACAADAAGAACVQGTTGAGAGAVVRSAHGAAVQVIAQVAARLGNTVAVCRKSYIHPAVLALGTALGDDDARADLLTQEWAAIAGHARSLSAAERRLMALLNASSPRQRSVRPRTASAENSVASHRRRSEICRTPRDRSSDRLSPESGARFRAASGRSAPAGR